MDNYLIIALMFCAVSIGCSNGASAIDYSDPESVSLVFLNAIKHRDYKIVQSIVSPDYQLRFKADAIKKDLGKMIIPDNPELKVNYKKNGKKAEVLVVGTKIGLELRLIEGRWLLEP